MKTLGYKIYFNSYEEIMNYLDYQTEFLTWQTKKFNLTSNTNINMDINTSFSAGYMVFSSLKSYIQKFYIDQGSLPITVDIKLICPDTYRESIDPNHYYSNFYLNLYSNKKLNYINLTYEERGINLIEEPFKAWVAYIVSGYNKWLNYYKE